MIAVRPFGSFAGRTVDLYTLTSETGVEVEIMTWGVTVRDWRVPVGDAMRSVVLGFERFESYPAHSHYFGAVVGRVANRIGNAQFTLDGSRYTLDANAAPHMLHGGRGGLSQMVWDAEPDHAGNAVIFRHTSPDGAMGFPGTIEVSATYQLTGNTLRLEIAASTDRATPVNMVQHHYFNLAGRGEISDHTFQFATSARLETDENKSPTGKILEIAPKSAWDFSTPRTLLRAANLPFDYDANLIFDPARDPSEPAVLVTSPSGDLSLRLWTDQPGVQFYNGFMLDDLTGGLNGASYARYAAFCIEDQGFVDAVNHPHFPSVIIAPDRPYRHVCAIEIG